MTNSKLLRMNEEELFYISLALQEFKEMLDRNESTDYIQSHRQDQDKKKINRLIEKISKAREELK